MEKPYFPTSPFQVKVGGQAQRLASNFDAFVRPISFTSAYSYGSETEWGDSVHTKLIYDKIGNLVETQDFLKDTLISREQFAYDSHGTLIQHITNRYYDQNPTTDTTFNDYQYDADGRIIFWAQRSSGSYRHITGKYYYIYKGALLDSTNSIRSYGARNSSSISQKYTYSHIPGVYSVKFYSNFFEDTARGNHLFAEYTGFRPSTVGLPCPTNGGNGNYIIASVLNYKQPSDMILHDLNEAGVGYRKPFAATNDVDSTRVHGRTINNVFQDSAFSKRNNGSWIKNQKRTIVLDSNGLVRNYHVVQFDSRTSAIQSVRSASYTYSFDFTNGTVSLVLRDTENFFSATYRKYVWRYKTPAPNAKPEGAKSLITYPNPAINSFRVNGLSKDSPYTLYSSTGSKTKSGIIKLHEAINTVGLAKGIYYLIMPDGRAKIEIK